MGWDSTIGKWARVEGTPSDPNPNDPYAKMDSETLFIEGKLTPSITILGKQAFIVTLALDEHISFSAVKMRIIWSRLGLRCIYNR